MSSTYTYSLTFNTTNGLGQVDMVLQLLVDDLTDTILQVIPIGSSLVTGIATANEINLMPPDTFNINDNVINNFDALPYFSQNGASFIAIFETFEFQFNVSSGGGVNYDSVIVFYDGGQTSGSVNYENLVRLTTQYHLTMSLVNTVLFGNMTIDLFLRVNIATSTVLQLDPGSTITSDSGTSTELTLLAPNSYNSNNNVISNFNTAPHFSSEGMAIIDGANFFYLLIYNGSNSLDSVILDAEGVINPTVVSESFTVSCVLDNSKVLMSDGAWVEIKAIVSGDKVLSSPDGKVASVKQVIRRGIPNSSMSSLVRIQQDGHAPLYITEHHVLQHPTLKHWVFPKDIDGAAVASGPEDWSAVTNFGAPIQLCHLELERAEGETRLDALFCANGFWIESFSNENLDIHALNQANEK